jgi:N-acetyl-anhydromuramoyl-L-alanine amidase
MTLDEGGRIAEARFVASPNCDDRPDDTDITLLVVHNISLPPSEFGGDEIERFFTNTLDCAAHPYFSTLRGVRVSAHFLIRRTGELVQFVPCAMRAWHAGASHWRGRDRCNDFSIGVELEGTDIDPYTDIQYDRLGALAAALLRRYPISDIVGHADIAPERKSDPGQAFDWDRFRSILQSYA